jgi:hypothetical protein
VRTWKCGSLHAFTCILLGLRHDYFVNNLYQYRGYKNKNAGISAGRKRGKGENENDYKYTHRIYLQNLGGMDNLLSDSLAI